MRNGLYIAPFGELADPRVVAEVAAAAEEAGWDGLFVWDHMLRPVEQATHLGDPWISLAAAAVATDRLLLGPLVTPPARRRVHKLIRETIAVDRLSNGRLILGLGLGVDSGGELTRFGEMVDPVERGDLLDEAVAVLEAAWTGEEVNHHGRYLTVDGVRFLPRALQEPHVPMWFAARGNAPRRPLRRAALHGQGLHIVDADRDQVARMIAAIAEERGSLDGYEFGFSIPPGTADEYTDWGLTWALHGTGAIATRAEVFAAIKGL